MTKKLSLNLVISTLFIVVLMLGLWTLEGTAFGASTPSISSSSDIAKNIQPSEAKTITRAIYLATSTSSMLQIIVIFLLMVVGLVVIRLKHHVNKLQLSKDNLEKMYHQKAHESDDNAEQLIYELEGRAEIENENKIIIEKLTHTSKMAALGTLSSGIVHELNNPLSVVMGYSELIANDPNASDNTKEYADYISKAALRMLETTKQLGRFSEKGATGSWKQLSLNGPIKQALVLLNSQLKSRGIELELDLNGSLQKIWGLETELESLFQALVTNSRDAFAEIRDGRSKKISIKTYQKEDSIYVEYKDNAGGLSEDAQNHLFDPFYTTKENSEGTGLGMFMFSSIMVRHQAIYELDSTENEGTVFSLEFPLDRREKNRNDVDLETEVKAA